MPLVTVDQFQIKINSLLVFLLSPPLFFTSLLTGKKWDKCTLGFNELRPGFREASLLRNALWHVLMSPRFCKEEWI